MAADVQADNPSEDRQELLVFDGDGAVAAIEMGSHAFAWRLPGVILGALTAACLYLLARILFRRRIVAALVGVFVLVDGMFFVQSRIGMNDVYVGFFIVAAYTVFAAVWTGWWRGRAAFWVAMPLIGALLGLALASKWVALYAIGGMVLLILVRSALGRVLAILGLIALTGVLGYMAMSVPEGQGFGNLTFLLVMIALTLIAVVVAIFHPIAWTDDEMRFAVVAPAVLGGLVFFGALALGRLDAQLVVGSLAITPLRAADRPRPRLSRGRRALHAGRAARLRAAGRPAAPGRTGLRPGTTGATGRGLAASRLAHGPAGRLDGRLPGRPAAGDLRRLVHPVGDDREPPDRRRLANWPRWPDAPRPDRPDVSLPQRPDRGASGLVAVVGLAAQPQARVVLPGGPGGGHVGGPLRRRQPRDLVARRAGAPVRQRHGLPPPEPGPDPHRGRLRRPVDPVGTDRPGRVPVPLLHGAAVRGPGPGLFRRGAVARRLARHLAIRPPRRRRGHRPAGRHVAALAAVVCGRRRRVGQPGLAGLSGGHPRIRADRAHGGPRDRRRHRVCPVDPRGPRPGRGRPGRTSRRTAAGIGRSA